MQWYENVATRERIMHPLAGADRASYEGKDDAVTKIPLGEAKAEPGYLRELNREMQVILDLPRQ